MFKSVKSYLEQPLRLYDFTDIEDADLVVDAIYEGGRSGNTGDDPISRLLPGCGNMGGFRYSGRGEKKNVVVLYTSGEEKDWPDDLDTTTGRFVYYGDNRTPGHELHQTHRKGNLVLKQVFDRLHSAEPSRNKIPPFFVFQKYPTAGSSRSVEFKGLAVSGYPGVPATDDLVAVWKTADGQRFQNYRAIFTILDVAKVSRCWVNDILGGDPETNNVPPAWKQWREEGRYSPLTSAPTTIIRSDSQQLPRNRNQERILLAIYDYFKNSPKGFEAFAAKVFKFHDARAIIDEITRGAVDGGRDAIGRYVLGVNEDPVYVEFSLEAKCYRPRTADQRASTVGVKEVSRLISRIRHRQFGVLVTTSTIARQAYEEVREDRHPIIFLCGKDIVEILIDKGYSTPEKVTQFLKNEFPNLNRERNGQ